MFIYFKYSEINLKFVQIMTGRVKIFRLKSQPTFTEIVITLSIIHFKIPK